MKNGPYELVVAPENYPGKKYRGRYCYEHHLVWWQNTGALPPEGFDVHHKNEQKRDNRFDNLELLSHVNHRKQHAQESPAPTVDVSCGHCRKKFVLKISVWKTRTKTKDVVYCSRSCGSAKHVSTTR